MTKTALMFWAKAFFALAPKRIKVEACPICNRTYFLYRGEIVAVGEFA